MSPAGASHHVCPCQFLVRRRIRLREDKLTAFRKHDELAVRRDNTPLADSSQPPPLVSVSQVEALQGVLIVPVKMTAEDYGSAEMVLHIPVFPGDLRSEERRVG